MSYEFASHGIALKFPRIFNGIQWSLQRKTAPSVVTKWSLVRVRSHVGVKNVQEILFGVDKGQSQVS